MANIQVSFLGRNKRREEEDVSGSHRYRRAKYRFPGPEGRVYAAPIFGWALWQHLCEQRTPPDVWLILGTAGSSWDCLADCLGADQWEPMLPWLERLERPVEQKAVTQKDLDAVPAHLAGSLGVGELRLVLIEECRDKLQQRDLMDVFLANLQAGDRVILDISHGYRHLPALASFMLITLGWLRDVRVGGMYSGALEMTGPDGLTPVINLSLCAEYTDMGSRLATWRTTGNYQEMSHVFSDNVAKKIDTASYYEQTNQLGRAPEPAKELGKSLVQSQASPDVNTDPLRREIAGQLLEAIGWADRSKLTGRMLERSRICLEASD